MRIVSVESTDLFAGTAQRPLQLIRVTLVNEGASMLATPAMSAAISVQGPGVRDPGPFGISDMNPGEQKAFEVPVEIAAPYQPGSTRQVTVTVTSDAGRTQAEAGLTVAEPGWTMWMVSHFHYDPVWWNTQGQFTEARLALPDEDGELPDVRSAFELVGAHLDKARRDADYKFVLAEIDYLKPYFDAFPQDREDLRRLMAEGRVEIVGGNYNEPNTNLTSAEAIIRNAVYGIGFQRDVFGGDPRSAWMLDAFGHDPGYPGLMAAAGLTSSAWARGPVPPVGPVRGRGRRPADAVQHRVRVDLPGRRRPAHRVHGAPLRRGLAAALSRRTWLRPSSRRTGSSAGWRRSRPPATSCSRSARTTSSRPAG